MTALGAEQMPFFLWFVVPLAWLLLAAVTGLIAEQRGYDFHEYYWLALLLPGISLALLYRKESEPVIVPLHRGPACSNCGEALVEGSTVCSMCGAPAGS